MMRLVIASLSGLLFGFGLSLSGMTDPMRVRAFLDVFGDWDPTLAFVMGGALAVMVPVWFVQKRMSASLSGAAFDLPKTTGIDRELITGGVLFGIGWGIAGLCPGPAIAALALDLRNVSLFVAAMLAGMAAHHLYAKT